MKQVRIGKSIGVSIIILAMTLTPTLSWADGLDECQKDVVLCDRAYQEQKELVEKLDTYVKELEKVNNTLNVGLDKEKREADKFHHNGIAMAGIGLGTGAAAVAVSPVIIPIVGAVVLIAVLFN